MPDTYPVVGRVIITNPIGLHARPAVKLTKLAKRFEAAISISKNTEAIWVDAKSIVRVMGLKVKAGEALLIRAHGPDAKKAVNALIRLTKEGFETDES